MDNVKYNKKDKNEKLDPIFNFFSELRSRALRLKKSSKL